MGGDLLFAAVQAANSSIVIADPKQPDCPLVFVNEGFVKTSGYSPEEALGQNCRFLQIDPQGRRDDGTQGFPHDRQQARELQKIHDAAEKEPVGVILRNYRKNGEPFWNELYLTPVFDDDGTCMAIVGVQNDVTDRVEALRDVRRTGRLLGGVFEAAPAMIGIVEQDDDGAWRHTKVNATAAQVFSREADEVVGRTLTQLGVGEEVVRIWEKAFADCTAGEEAVRLRTPRPIADPDAGEETSIAPLEAQGHYRLAVASLQEVNARTMADKGSGGRIPGEESRRICYVADDLSDLTRSEADRLLLQAAVENAEESVLITGPALDRPGPEIVYVNPAFTRITGYTRDEVQGQTPRILQGPLTDPAVINRLRRALDSGGRFRGETINYRKDGSTYTVDWSISPIRGNEPSSNGSVDGEVKYWVSTQRDVSERRLLEREVLEIQAEEQSRIARDLHDSVTQTLHALSLRTEILKDDARQGANGEALVAELEELGELAVKAADQARSISHSMLPQDVQRSGLMLALQRLAAETRQVWGVECTFAYEHPVLLKNPERAGHLYRIVQEAVGNAVRHGKAKSILIGLADDTLEHEAERTQWVLTIKDDGLGIPEKIAAAVNQSQATVAPMPGEGEDDEAKRPGVGMHTMRYRAGMANGKLTVERGNESADRPGTVVACTFSTSDADVK